MGYPADLDEMPERRLLAELEQRRKLRAEGKCDYCRQELPTDRPCRFPERHRLREERALKAPERLDRDRKIINEVLALVLTHPDLPCDSDEISLEDLPAFAALLMGQIEDVYNYTPVPLEVDEDEVTHG